MASASELVTVKNRDFRRGAFAAAAVADVYDSSSTHRYRLGDCILGKLNIRNGRPRINRQRHLATTNAWLAGFAIALAEMHRLLIGGGDSKGVCRVASAAGLTLANAHAAGVSNYDLKELKKAGVR